MPKGEGPALWEKAKKIIPGGTQLLSKRAEMFLPGFWPAYYKKAKGAYVWDLDGNKLADMCYMGIGSCILGYADEKVDKAVIEAIQNGSMSTLNCHEDVELAELLLKINPWAQMVRYSRTGGEAMAIAVRAARAFSGKDTVAFCGYHGWHDWYLAANLSSNKNLDGHLLPGLNPLGVPRGLKGTALPFNYNKIEELEKIVQENDIGTIVMEAVRDKPPENGFLKKARKIASDIGAVLIFDEVTSGWRLRVGGAHEIYGVRPDIAVYGKAMSNGYAMSAIVGKSEIMDVVQSSFISSTFWTERVGPVASIATIERLTEEKVPEKLIKTGRKIRNSWESLAKENDLDMVVEGIDSLPKMHFNVPDQQSIITFITQEMLAKGFLAAAPVYVCWKHDDSLIKSYMEALNDVFHELNKCLANNSLEKRLKGPPAIKGFKRLT